jgi:ABC-type glycerol-3-phosphate transport system substrate-binding protein
VYYNATTLKNLGLKPPPPVGNWTDDTWTWADFNKYLRKIKGTIHGDLSSLL